MRRGLVVILTVLAVGSISGPAGARTLRIRTDPNDSSSNLDIHRVITDLSDTRLYLRIDSWQRFHPKRMQGEYVFYLDTFGTPAYDRIVDVFVDARGLDCDVQHYRVKVDIGRRLATRASGRSVACNLPRAWFGHIHRAVRFVAIIGFPPTPEAADSAPDHGVYRWI